MTTNTETTTKTKQVPDFYIFENAGEGQQGGKPVGAGFAHKKKPGRREWLRVRLAPGADGIPVARKFARDGAGILSSLVESQGLVELAEAVEDLDEGTLVDYLPFNEAAR